MTFDEWWEQQQKDPTEPITPRMAWDAAIAESAACVPTSWLDRMLSGPAKLVGDKIDHKTIEAVLRATRDRILARSNARLTGATPEGGASELKR